MQFTFILTVPSPYGIFKNLTFPKCQIQQVSLNKTWENPLYQKGKKPTSKKIRQRLDSIKAIVSNKFKSRNLYLKMNN